MNCKNCGMQNTNEDVFCRGCGQNLNNMGQINQVPMGTSNNIEQINQVPMRTPDNMRQSSPKKDNKKVFIIVGAVLVAIIIAFIIFNVVDAEIVIGEVETGNEVLNNDTNPGNDSDVASVSYYKVNIDNFTFSIPDEYIYFTQYESGYDCLYVYNAEETFLIGMGIMEGNYNTLADQIDVIKSNAITSGYTVTDSGINIINNKEYIYLDVTYNGEDMKYIYSSLNSMFVALITINTYGIDINDDMLEVAINLVSNSSYSSSSTNMKIDSSFDLNLLTGVLD